LLALRVTVRALSENSSVRYSATSAHRSGRSSCRPSGASVGRCRPRLTTNRSTSTTSPTRRTDQQHEGSHLMESSPAATEAAKAPSIDEDPALGLSVRAKLEILGA